MPSVRTRNGTKPSEDAINQRDLPVKTRSSKIRDTPGFSHVHTQEISSLLSSDAGKHTHVNLRGMVHCGAILLLASNLPKILRTAVDNGENIRKMIVNSSFRSETGAVDPVVAVFLSFPVFATLSYNLHRLEYNYSRKALKRSLLYDMLHGINGILSGVIPYWLIYTSNCNPLTGLISLLTATCLFMKLWSFAHVCHSVRHHAKEIKELKLQHKPSWKHFTYFLVAPTLCYQFSYPRTPRIRLRFLGRRIIEMILCASLAVMLSTQYIHVMLDLDSEAHFLSDNFVSSFDIIAVLAAPSTCIWLLLFYAFFHSFLNFNSELLRFGDRLFYRDWWNACDLGEYWRKWNLPVHFWAMRHLFSPLLRLGFSYEISMLGVFIFSAIFHEISKRRPTWLRNRQMIIIDGAIHMIPKYPYGFLGMLSQMPIILFSKKIVKSGILPKTWLNASFWITFCVVGQPLLVLLYMQDYLHTGK
eukprot:15220_1